MVYDYDRDWVYEIYTQPLRATDICLEPGEQLTEAPFNNDDFSRPPAGAVFLYRSFPGACMRGAAACRAHLAFYVHGGTGSRKGDKAKEKFHSLVISQLSM